MTIPVSAQDVISSDRVEGTHVYNSSGDRLPKKSVGLNCPAATCVRSPDTGPFLRDKPLP